jgi:DNA-binding NarL/FixJ family response regulator
MLAAGHATARVSRVVRTVRVLVVLGERLIAEGLSRRLDAEPGIRTVGIASTAAAVPTAVDALGPDVVVLQMELEGESALQLTGRLVNGDPPVRVVALLGADDATAAIRAIRAGASAVVAKDSPATELIGAVLAVAKDHGWVPPHLLSALLRELRRSMPPPNPHDKKLSRLTARERDVLDRMVAGCDRATIARELMVSVGTVRTHARNILAKLEVHSSLQAVSVARRGNGASTC